MSGEEVTQRAAEVIAGRLAMPVDTGMGGLEPLLDVYRPEGIALVLAGALDDAGLLAKPKSRSASTRTRWWRRSSVPTPTQRRGWIDEAAHHLRRHLNNDRSAE